MLVSRRTFRLHLAAFSKQLAGRNFSLCTFQQCIPGEPPFVDSGSNPTSSTYQLCDIVLIF